MKMYVVVDDYERDAIAVVVDAMDESLAEVVPLSRLLRTCGAMYDEENLMLSTASLRLPSKLAGNVVLNRVVTVSDRTLRLIDNDTGVLEGFQVLSVLGLLLRSLPTALGHPGLFCGTGVAYPLHLQYKAVADRLATVDIKAPEFHLSSRGEDPAESFSEGMISKSVWDLWDWRADAETSVDDPNAICIVKPEGRAEVLYFIGDEIGGLCLESGGALETQLLELARPWINLLRITFSATCGEVLVIRSGDCLVFMSFTHALETSATDAQFANVVNLGLKGLAARNKKIVPNGLVTARPTSRDAGSREQAVIPR